MTHRNCIIKTAFVLLAALVGSLFNEHCGAASTNAMDKTPTDTNLAAKVATDYEKYKKGQIDKGTMAKSLWNAWNQTSQDMYGKVTDQNGQPVAGVDVTGISERLNDQDIRYKTQTDTNGLFQFTGLHGYRLDAQVTKSGYEIIYQGGRIKPQGPSTPDNRVIFMMWKRHGAEPMIHDSKFYGINPDGRIYTLDLVERKKTEGTNAVGDLWVQIQRPTTIKPGEKFGWSLVMTAIGGGVIEVTNAVYLYEAPESGYQQTYELHMNATAPNWQEQSEKTFYIKSRDGKVFGHFHVNIIPNYNDTSVFDMESYVNPGGSRNLEYDSSKQIMR